MWKNVVKRSGSVQLLVVIVGKIELKREKFPLSLGLEGQFFQFVTDTLGRSPLHFSDDQFCFSNRKIWLNIEKTVF